jgi:subtilisin family serine protease
VVEREDAAPPAPGPPPERRPIAHPAIAFQLGLMPLASTGVTEFRAAHPGYDGRGVLLAILDSGTDLGVPGLQTTTTAQRKVLDARDFSGEGDVALEPVTPAPDGTVRLADGLTLRGLEQVRALAPDGWYGGVLAERPFGLAPEADFNRNGTNGDRYGVLVVHGPAGWVAFVDADADGSFANETPIADYLVRGETFTFASRWAARGRGPITAALNLTEQDGRPRLAFFLDPSSHGTAVAGVATGHGLYGVSGFDGVAPGAFLLALKIANNTRGGVTATGSMLRAMEYAARFARERRLPLVMNMSFGIGNETEGRAVMDSIVDAFCLAHPDVVFVIAAGNDGPGTSTLGLPGSAELALTAGSLYPGAYTLPQFGVPGSDVMGWWSSRGGELAKPDLLAPGIAYTSVPRWNTGEEVKNGTSFSSPHLAGLAALLVSAMAQEGRTVSAAEVIAALEAGARLLPGASAVDQGAGVPNVEAAYRWLRRGLPARRYRIEALAAGPAPSGGLPFRPASGPDVAASRTEARPSAAYRRNGLASHADTVQRFRVSVVQGSGVGGRGSGRATAAGAWSFRLSSDAQWLHPARPTFTLDSLTGSGVIEVRYDAAALARPGRYVGTVRAVPAGDSTAGTAFHLVNTVIVPDSLRGRLATPSRKLDAGAAARFYYWVPDSVAGLAVRLVARDTLADGTLYLFEPSGRPARGTERDDFGGSAGANATVMAPAQDVLPGVYEAVVQAMPGGEVGYHLEAATPVARVAELDSARGSLAVTLVANADTSLEVTTEQVGLGASFTIDVVHGAVTTRALTVPEWVTELWVEVRLDRAVWDEVTDFSITLFDADGNRLASKPMNYVAERLVHQLPERTGPMPVTLELFPAFARAAPARVTARVTIRYLSAPRSVAMLTSPGQSTIRLARGRPFQVRIPPGSVRESEGEWMPVVRLRAGAARDDWAALERTFTVVGPAR